MGAERWESVDLGPDGRTGWMRFSTGDPACSSFDHIQVDSTGGIPGLFAVIAFPVDQPQLCTAIAQLHREPFTLPAPLILGGVPPA